jgi:hypothetical protein
MMVYHTISFIKPVRKGSIYGFTIPLGNSKFLRQVLEMTISLYVSAISYNVNIFIFPNWDGIAGKT